jgi:hypothetical protein
MKFKESESQSERWYDLLLEYFELYISINKE